MNPSSHHPKRKPETSGADSQNAIDLLKADHREVDQLFEQFKSAKGRQQRKKLVRLIGTALNAHTIIEEEIFYPACSEHGIEEDDLDEAQVEHDTVKLLVRELVEGSLDDDYYDAKMTVLSEYVKHHVEEEEDPKEGIFARLEKTDADLDELGRELQDRKDALLEDPERLIARPPRIRSLHVGAGQSTQQNASGSDHLGGRQAFDDRRNQNRGRSRGSEGHGGWQGDPDGHAEAARRGWRHRDH